MRQKKRARRGGFGQNGTDSFRTKPTTIYIAVWASRKAEGTLVWEYVPRQGVQFRFFCDAFVFHFWVESTTFQPHLPCVWDMRGKKQDIILLGKVVSHAKRYGLYVCQCFHLVFRLCSIILNSVKKSFVCTFFRVHFFLRFPIEYSLCRHPSPILHAPGALSLRVFIFSDLVVINLGLKDPMFLLARALGWGLEDTHNVFCSVYLSYMDLLPTKWPLHCILQNSCWVCYSAFAVLSMILI